MAVDVTDVGIGAGIAVVARPLLNFVLGAMKLRKDAATELRDELRSELAKSKEEIESLKEDLQHCQEDCARQIAALAGRLAGACDELGEIRGKLVKDGA